MSDIASLAERAATGTGTLARLGAGLARRLAIFAGVLAVICILIALFGLAGSATVVALVLTAGAVLLAVVGPALAWWRLRDVDGQVQALSSEFRTLFERDRTVGQNVIETVEHGETMRAPTPGPQGTRAYAGVRNFDLEQLRGLTHVRGVFASLARLPAVLALAFLGTFALVILALAFALAALI